ncbi:zinc ABC transporter substrate-binding protein [Candidatus Saccharibacteria bacterium]|nr:zinc ABC transporter substrate-binding protein [Candidatus Saccharibacteria bacterium]
MSQKSKPVFIISFLLAVVLAVFFVFKPRPSAQTYTVISSNFIGYDLARAVLGSSDDVRMLLKPGAEAHTYDPTPKDILELQSTDLFIYTGGESDEWVRRLISSNQLSSTNTLRLMDSVELKEEELVEGMEDTHEHEEHEEDTESPEYDEHIWTSPKNAILLTRAVEARLVALFPDRASELHQNADVYIAQLSTLDQQFSELVQSSARSELIFADRFPFRYFVDTYNLDYYAAFPSCSDQTEASAATVAFLIDKVKSDHIPVVLKIELSSDKLARQISESTGAKIRELHAAHNITKDDFEAGVTLPDLLKRNLKVLKEALN